MSSSATTKWLAALVAVLALEIAAFVFTTPSSGQGLITTLNSSPTPLPNCTPATTSTMFEPLIFNTTTNRAQYCSATNTWSDLGISGGGSGTVTTFSSGNLSPIFTTSVSSASTTPAQTFALSNAAALTVLGNSSGSSAAPAYVSLTSAMLPVPMLLQQAANNTNVLTCQRFADVASTGKCFQVTDTAGNPLFWIDTLGIAHSVANQLTGGGAGVVTGGAGTCALSVVASGNFGICLGDGTSNTIQITNNGTGWETAALWNNTSPTLHGVVVNEGFPAIATSTAGTAGQPFVSGGASADGAYSNTYTLGPVVLASLGTPANGTVSYCSDCLVASDPCTGSSTGAMAFRLNGRWRCQ